MNIFVRAYLQNDGGTKRGAVTKGKLIPDPKREIWFNQHNGMVLQIDNPSEDGSKTSCYAYDDIQGDETFKLYFFKDNFETKTFNDLIGNKPIKINRIKKKNG